jgi:adenylate cyclase
MLRERFHQRSRGDGPLAGFACGIGIAAGPIVAGMLGTIDQRKIGVFGPAVNLAARLETMTKQLGASILMDDKAQQALREAGGGLAARLRYLASVQPVGMDTFVRVYELMPPAASSLALSTKHLKLFEFGRGAFEQGRWDDARDSLRKLAQAGDGPSRFLVNTMDRMQEPPSDWRGGIQLTAK